MLRRFVGLVENLNRKAEVRSVFHVFASKLSAANRRMWISRSRGLFAGLLYLFCGCFRVTPRFDEGFIVEIKPAAEGLFRTTSTSVLFDAGRI